LKGKIDAAKVAMNEAEEKKKERKDEEKEGKEEDAATISTKGSDKKERETITTPIGTLDNTKKSKKGKKKRKAGEEGEAAVEDEPATPRQSKKKQKNGAPTTAALKGGNDGDKHSLAAVGEAEVSFPWGKTIKRLIKKAEGRKMDRQTLQKEALALASKTSTQSKKGLKRQFKEALGGGVAGVQVNGEVVMLIK